MSPFIFFIVIDYFSSLLSHLQLNQVINGVIFYNNCSLNHILFADDILLFVEDDDDALKNLNNAIYLFEKAFGLSINHSKSTISLINVVV